MLTKRERERLVKQIKRQLNKLISNRYLKNKEADNWRSKKLIKDDLTNVIKNFTMQLNKSLNSLN